MTQYLMSVCAVDGAEQLSPEAMQQMFADVGKLNDRMQAEGAWVFAGGLYPVDTATVVRMQDGELVTTDGPFAKAKEHMVGFWVINADDLDAALAWAADATRACRQPVEVRPFQDAPEV